MQRRRDEIIERIVKNIVLDDDTECWLWQGSTSGKPESGKTGRGYGRMNLNGSTMAVHRVVYTHFYGIIPHKGQIDHKCNTRRCCNPKHLELVTHKQNMKRRDRRNDR